jgi:hypothetical protein
MYGLNDMMPGICFKITEKIKGKMVGYRGEID